MQLEHNYNVFLFCENATFLFYCLTKNNETLFLKLKVVTISRAFKRVKHAGPRSNNETVYSHRSASCRSHLGSSGSKHNLKLKRTSLKKAYYKTTNQQSVFGFERNFCLWLWFTNTK